MSQNEISDIRETVCAGGDRSANERGWALVVDEGSLALARTRRIRANAQAVRRMEELVNEARFGRVVHQIPSLSPWAVQQASLRGWGPESD